MAVRRSKSVKAPAKAAKAKTKQAKPKTVVKVSKAKKNPAKAKTTKKAVVKKVTKKKLKVFSEKQTRIEILQTLAENTDLTKTQVEKVFESLVTLMKGHMTKKGSGEFTIPMTGIKIRSVLKKATKARTMVSPLTQQEVKIAGKPARRSVKVTALKALKDMVEAK